MHWRQVLCVAGGLAVFLVAGQAACQAATPQYEYRASWIALASPEPVTVEVERKSWAKLISFRPERGFTLAGPLTERGKRKPRLETGAVMVAMKDSPGIACRLERPQFDYVVECVQEGAQDGQYEGFFLLNHDKPFLFSAIRQPRHQKMFPSDAVTLNELAPGQLPTIDMVFLYPAGSVISGAGASHRFQLCILRPDDRNLWGDKTHDRGCLPDIVVKDGDFPRRLQVYGRTLEIAAPADGRVAVSVTACPEDLPAEL